MKNLPLLAAANLILLTACSPSPQTLILGKWQTGNDNVGIQFFDDGQAVISGPGAAFKAKWSMPSKDVLAVSASHQGLTFKEETPFSVDKHTLTLTEKNGRETVYTRVKE